jgi:hypothetical protein
MAIMRGAAFNSKCSCVLKMFLRLKAHHVAYLASTHLRRRIAHQARAPAQQRAPPIYDMHLRLRTHTRSQSKAKVCWYTGSLGY